MCSFWLDQKKTRDTKMLGRLSVTGVGIFVGEHGEQVLKNEATQL